MTTFTGTNGNDSISSAADIIYGRRGDDTIHATNALAPTIHGGEGNDVVVYDPPPGTDPSAALFGDDGADRLQGASSSEFLSGGRGDDTLTAGGGYDLLDGGRGADLFIADQFDTVTYASAGGPMRADLLDPSGNTGDAAGDRYVGIQRMIGSDFGDRLSGDDAWNSVFGGAGDDVILGRGGFDELFGEAGQDFLSGGEDDDRLYGGAGDDTLVGGNGGFDQLEGDDGDDYLEGEVGYGGEGNDTLVGTDVFTALGGGPGDDLLIAGQSGLVVLNGGSGTDTLIGRDGDDALGGGPGADRLEGGPGADTAWYGTAVRADLSNPATNTGDAQGDTYSSIENLEGSEEGNDILKGNNGRNVLEGFGGDDRLIGLGGSDTLHGSTGNDTLEGQGGHDLLDGSYGADRMTGGAGGWDIFKFDLLLAYPGSQFRAVVADFEDGADRIRLDFEPFYGDPPAPLHFDHVVVTQHGPDVLLTFDVGAPGSTILLLNQSAANITAADFLAG
jgi:Ca2+-binding RTX toxin-like protein